MKRRPEASAGSPTKGSWLITLVGELCLFAGGIMWWDFLLRGAASLGVVLPAAFTFGGVVWLGWGLGLTPR